MDQPCRDPKHPAPPAHYLLCNAQQCRAKDRRNHVTSSCTSSDLSLIPLSNRRRQKQRVACRVRLHDRCSCNRCRSSSHVPCVFPDLLSYVQCIPQGLCLGGTDESAVNGWLLSFVRVALVFDFFAGDGCKIYITKYFPLYGPNRIVGIFLSA